MAIAAPTPRVIADAIPQSFARDALLVVGGAAFVGLAAQISFPLPFTPVPITGQTFAVLLTGAAIGPLRGILSMLLYSLAGLAGVPWFAGLSSGYASASFGYIVGFILGAGLVGWLAERGWTRTAVDTALAMVLGNVVIYGFGVVWLKFAIDVPWGTAVELGMTPFLLGDALKIAVAAGLFPLVWLQLTKRGLVEARETDAPATPPLPTGVPEVVATSNEAGSLVVDLTTIDTAEATIDLRDGAAADAPADTTER